MKKYALVLCLLLAAALVSAQSVSEPISLQVKVRSVALPKGGAAIVYLDTDKGTLTLSGELDEAPVLRWLILHGGQAVTLTVGKSAVSSAAR